MENMSTRNDFTLMFKPRRITILWDIMIWLGLIVALVWAILKTFGIT